MHQGPASLSAVTGNSESQVTDLRRILGTGDRRPDAYGVSDPESRYRTAEQPEPEPCLEGIRECRVEVPDLLDLKGSNRELVQTIRTRLPEDHRDRNGHPIPEWMFAAGNSNKADLPLYDLRERFLDDRVDNDGVGCFESDSHPKFTGKDLRYSNKRIGIAGRNDDVILPRHLMPENMPSPPDRIYGIREDRR